MSVRTQRANVYRGGNPARRQLRSAAFAAVHLAVVLTIFQGTLSTAVFAWDAPGTRPPNVVLILVDDMGFSDLGCYGSEIQTPNLDRIASQGLRFTQFYNCGKCETTRRTLLTGNYHPEVNLSGTSNMTLAELMRSAGYRTLMTGKWHIRGTPLSRGFDRYFGHLSGATDFFVGDDTFLLDDQSFQVPSEGFYTTRVNTDYAIEFLDEAGKLDKPFFLYMAYNAPHYPLQAPKDVIEKYRGKYLEGWQALRAARYQRQLEMGLFDKPWPLSPAHPEVRDWDSLSDEQKQREDLKMATFAAMIDVVDQNIGRLVQKLESMQAWENTLFLMLSDNGACPFDRTRRADLMPWEPHSHWCYDQSWANACNTPLRWFKQNQHEGGISTPLIARWPNTIKPGTITHQAGHLVDIMATLVDVTGSEYPESRNGHALRPLRGMSLTPIFRGEQRPGHEGLFFQFANNRAVRMGNWKLVSARGGPWELYDLGTDRTELHDLAGDHPQRVADMASAWDRWARETGLKIRR